MRLKNILPHQRFILKHFNRKYRFTLEDESSLEKKVNFSARTPLLILLLFAVAVCAGAFGMFLIASTPIKKILPGYLQENERTATEEQHLRLDSLIKVYEMNEAYIRGVLSALNPSTDSLNRSNSHKPVPLTPDSILPFSQEEKFFLENIRDRDRYNIAYTSPAAAQTMMFGNVNKAAVITEDTKEKYKAEIILPIGVPVATVAEGKVISVASSPKASGGYEVIIQHPKGFLSKTSRITGIMVHPGERVAAGEIIASGTSNSGLKGNRLMFELWHDGDPLIPGRYLQ